MSGRCTLARSVTLSGVGLFTSRPARLTISPSPVDQTEHAEHGIVFLTPGGPIRAAAGAISGVPLIPLFAKFPPRHTCLANADGSWMLGTIEHVMSSLVGLGVTDAVIECDGPEVPIFDGSSEPFVRAMLDVGLVEHDGAGCEPIVVDRELRIEDGMGASGGERGGGERGGGVIVISPRAKPGCSYTYELEYAPQPDGTSVLGAQRATWDGTRAGYMREVAPARTYCLEQEAMVMRSMGLFEHLTPRDMLVIGTDGPIDNALRFENEPARHKLLDLIGDMGLVGRPLQADVIATRSGHALAHQAARAILAAHA